MKTLNALQYENSLRKLLEQADTRIFLWRLIVEDCRVFQEDFTVNAGAYCLLAKQEIGKRLLADAKAVDMEKVQLAEREYQEMLRRAEEEQKDNMEDENEY